MNAIKSQRVKKKINAMSEFMAKKTAKRVITAKIAKGILKFGSFILNEFGYSGNFSVLHILVVSFISIILILIKQSVSIFYYFLLIIPGFMLLKAIKSSWW